MTAGASPGRTAKAPLRLAFGVLVAASAAAFAANAALGEVRPGNRWSVSYGVAAAVLLLAAALFGLRRRAVSPAARFRLGTARTWLDVHLLGGSAFLLLMLMHSGFRLPTGTLDTWLWVLSVWTVASGAAGLLLQRWLPKVLSSGLAVEVLYERIPELVAELREKAEALVATCDEPVRNLYRQQLAPALAGPRRRFIYFFDITGGIRSRLKELEYLRSFLSAEEQEKLDTLERIYRTKLELDAHYTLQQPLRLWLLAHVPTSIALLALVALHVFSVLYY